MLADSKPTALATLLFLALLMNGCMTMPPAPLPPQPSAETQQPQSELRYGTVTSRVVKDKTTQTELVELFGGPDIATTDAAGTETWVYESKSSTSTSQSQSAVSARGAGLHLFFFGEASAQARDQNSGTSTYSTKNVTLIVNFNKDKTVKDYSVRQSSS